MLSAANVTLLGQTLEENDLYASPFQNCKDSYSHDSDALYAPERAASSPVVYPDRSFEFAFRPSMRVRFGTHWNSCLHYCAFVLYTMVRNVRARLLRPILYTFRNDTTSSQAIATHDTGC